MPRGSLRCLRKKYSSHQRLKRGYLSCAEGRQRVVVDAMEVRGVVFEAVVRRQVHAATEPRHRHAAGRRGGEHAHVHVHGGHIGVAWVEHQRHTHGLERRAGQLGPVLRGRRRQGRPAHMREADATAFEQGTLFEQARHPLALQLLSRRLAPGVAHEGPQAVGDFECVDDALLQAEQVVAGCGDGRGRVHRDLQVWRSRTGAASSGR